MKRLSNQSGFSAVEAVLVVVVIGVIAGIGFMVYNRNGDTATATETTNKTVSTDSSAGGVSTAPSSINSTGDLDKAATTLDQNDPATANSSDSTQLDSQTNGL